MPIGVQGICRDITARKQTEPELRRLAELNRHQALHDTSRASRTACSFGQQIDARAPAWPIRTARNSPCC